MSPSRPDSALRDLLAEAESELSGRLREACEAEARGVSSDSTEEIRRLEDTLLAAAMAASRTLAARRHLDAGGSKDAPDAGSPRTVNVSGSRPAPPPSPPDAQTSGEFALTGGNAVREFEDETGRAWRAWPVTPNLARAREVSRRSLGDFQEGWICFEAMDDSGRRRLPRMGRRWSDLPIEELPRLLAQAINVPKRQLRGGDVARGTSTDELH